MSELRIPLNRKNSMDLLLEENPNLCKDMLLKGACYLFVMKKGEIVIYDCRNYPDYYSCKIRGFGYEFDKLLTHHNSKVATRHIQSARSGVEYDDIKTLYLLCDKEYDSFKLNLENAQESFHNLLMSFSEAQGCDYKNRYFCNPQLDIIINIKPNGLKYDPQWCKASAVYDAVEELSLISPHSTGFTWWYYPGRMYCKWKEITENDYALAKKYISEKEDEAFNWINKVVEQ